MSQRHLLLEEILVMWTRKKLPLAKSLALPSTVCSQHGMHGPIALQIAVTAERPAHEAWQQLQAMEAGLAKES